ncbi:MAG: integrase [Rhodobacteraceae bacterium PARR1]|nr:MAG: integrase [Rhodobacteraceae bacterium PARR1]
MIKSYLASPRYADLSDSRKRSLRRELDWLHEQAGTLPAARLEKQHVEALMGRKGGPAAANQVRKNLSALLKFARSEGILSKKNDAASLAYKRKTNPDGYHTWTEEDVSRFIDFHGPGTKARLALMIFLCTGASRQDAARMGRGNVVNGRIRYSRGKTGVSADLPILAELQAELDRLPSDQFIFLAHTQGRPYTVESLGNWFKDQCMAAGVTEGSAHGLRKSGATRLAEAGATEWEIASFLAHKDTKTAAIYVRKANRARLASNGMARLGKITGTKAD